MKKLQYSIRVDNNSYIRCLNEYETRTSIEEEVKRKLMEGLMAEIWKYTTLEKQESIREDLVIYTAKARVAEPNECVDDIVHIETRSKELEKRMARIVAACNENAFIHKKVILDIIGESLNAS